jgi:hypothetical protein
MVKNEAATTAEKRPVTASKTRSGTASKLTPRDVEAAERRLAALPVVVVFREDPLPNGDTVWTIKPQEEEENAARFDFYRSEIEARWASCHGKGPVPGSDHLPIIFNEGQQIIFRNDTGYDIGIGMHRQHHDVVDEFPGAPDDPLEREPGVRHVPRGKEAIETVKAAGVTPGPKHQGFYKFYGWVKVDGTFHPVDPDGYCGG